MKIPFISNGNNTTRKSQKITLITTAVTPLSTQKYVPDLRAYCSENFLIISTDLSDGSPEVTKKLHSNYLYPKAVDRNNNKKNNFVVGHLNESTEKDTANKNWR